MQTNQIGINQILEGASENVCNDNLIAKKSYFRQS